MRVPSRSFHTLTSMSSRKHSQSTADQSGSKDASAKRRAPAPDRAALEAAIKLAKGNLHLLVHQTPRARHYRAINESDSPASILNHRKVYISSNHELFPRRPFITPSLTPNFSKRLAPSTGLLFALLSSTNAISWPPTKKEILEQLCARALLPLATDEDEDLAIHAFALAAHVLRHRMQINEAEAEVDRNDFDKALLILRRNKIEVLILAKREAHLEEHWTKHDWAKCFQAAKDGVVDDDEAMNEIKEMAHECTAGFAADLKKEWLARMEDVIDRKAASPPASPPHTEWVRPTPAPAPVSVPIIEKIFYDPVVLSKLDMDYESNRAFVESIVIVYPPRAVHGMFTKFIWVDTFEDQKNMRNCIRMYHPDKQKDLDWKLFCEEITKLLTVRRAAIMGDGS